MMYGNGDVFEGLWAGDKKHGPGTHFYMSRGKRCDGVWQVRARWCVSPGPAGLPPSAHAAPLTPPHCLAPRAQDGTLKAGSYSEIHTPAPGTSGSLPPCELVNTQAVLDSALGDALAAL